VEFALIASLLFMIMFGVIQFGIAYNRYQGVEGAAREGARLASVGATYADIATRVKTAANQEIVSIASWQDQCSPDPPTLQDRLCAVISYVDTSGAKVTISSGTATPPCKVASANNPGNPQVVVDAKYKMAITIPFVFNTITPVVTGEGIFRCEN
jgi:Flp pilus assembly protein TadG